MEDVMGKVEDFIVSLTSLPTAPLIHFSNENYNLVSNYILNKNNINWVGHKTKKSLFIWK